jgi:hypothetical protein
MARGDRGGVRGRLSEVSAAAVRESLKRHALRGCVWGRVHVVRSDVAMAHCAVASPRGNAAGQRAPEGVGPHLLLAILDPASHVR